MAREPESVFERMTAPAEFQVNDFEQGKVSGVSYVLRGAKDKPDGRGQKLGAESFQATVDNKAHQRETRLIWGHGLKTSGGFFGGPIRDEDATMGNLRFHLTDKALEFDAEVFPKPGTPGDVSGLMAARLDKMASGTVGQNSIGFMRKQGSTTIKGFKKDEQTGNKALISREASPWDSLDKGEWFHFVVQQLLESSPVTWGVDGKTKHTSIQALQSGSKPELDSMVAYDVDGVVRYGLVLGAGADKVCISDIETQERKILGYSDVIPVSADSATPSNESPAEEPENQSAGQPPSPAVESELQTESSKDWAKVISTLNGART